MAWLARERASFSDRTIVLDAGDTFFSSTVLSPVDDVRKRAASLRLADALKQMQTSALVVGEHDLALGVDWLWGLADRSGAVLLAANLSPSGPDAHAFPEFASVRRGGVTFGIVGLASKRLPARTDLGLSVRPDPSRVVLTKAAEAARAAGAEVVIALVRREIESARRLLAVMPPGLIQVAIVSDGARPRARALEILRPSGVAIVEPGYDGCHLAKLEFAQKKAPAPDVAARADESVASFSNVEHGFVQLAVAPSGRVFLVRGAIIELRGEEGPRSFAANVSEDERVGSVRFVGTEACRRCHEGAYRVWRASGHARAWRTLLSVKQGGNLDCLPCHATGFGLAGGPRDAKSLRSLDSVGCESCHGAGSAHVAAPDRPGYGSPGVGPSHNVEAKCRQCHRAQADQRSFAFRARLREVLGAGHGARLLPRRPGLSPK